METIEYLEELMAGRRNYEADITAKRIANFIESSFSEFSVGAFAVENLIVIYGSQRIYVDAEFENKATWWATALSKYEGFPIAGHFSGQNIWTIVIEDTGCTYDVLKETKKILAKFLKTYAKWIASPGNMEHVEEECRDRTPKVRI